jgi:hypothetical protein
MSAEKDTVKVMISLPRPLLETVDRAAAAEHRSRSEFLREAARYYVQRRVAGGRPIDDPAVRRAVTLMDRLAQWDQQLQPDDEWDTVEAVRRTRRRGHER